MNSQSLSEKNHRRMVYLLPILLYCLLIFIESSLPSPGGVPDMGPVDKLIHILMYMILGALVLRGFLGMGKSADKNTTLIWSIFLSALYGVSDEIHQYFVSVRSADPFDALADLTGSFIGVFFYLIFVVGYANVVRKIPGLTKIGEFIKHGPIGLFLQTPMFSRIRALMRMI